MKTITRYAFPVLLIMTMVLSACGAQATEAPATGAQATEAPATGAPATEAPIAGGACPAGVDGTAIEMWSPFTGPDGDEMTALADYFGVQKN